MPANPALAGPLDQGHATSGADVAVMEWLRIVKMKDLDFGRFAASTTGATMALNPDTGVCTVTGGAPRISGCQAAEFGGFGSASGQIRIRVRISSG